MMSITGARLLVGAIRSAVRAYIPNSKFGVAAASSDLRHKNAGRLPALRMRFGAHHMAGGMVL